MVQFSLSIMTGRRKSSIGKTMAFSGGEKRAKVGNNSLTSGVVSSDKIPTEDTKVQFCSLLNVNQSLDTWKPSSRITRRRVSDQGY